jgi:hypothetical protein
MEVVFPLATSFINLALRLVIGDITFCKTKQKTRDVSFCRKRRKKKTSTFFFLAPASKTKNLKKLPK